MVEDDIKFVGASCQDDGRINVVILVKDYINHDFVEVSIPRDELTPQNIYKVIINNNGICKNAKVTCHKLKTEFDNQLLHGELTVKNFHEHLGWHVMKGKIVFYAQEALCDDSQFKSEYCGILDLKQTGCLENISSMIEKEIINPEDWSPLEAVISFGVGATVLSYANTVWNASLNNLMLHLVGGSSTGKSTSLALFTGLGSNPVPKHGFWINYNSSEVSIVKKIGQNNGYPVALDELSNGSRKDYDSLVYSIGNGEEKDRLKAGGTSLQDSVTFQTVVLSSGEVSLMKKCKNNGGIRARCVEFSNIYWTASKRQSEAIKECVKGNHGLVTPAVAMELIKHNKKWQVRWAYWKKKVNAQMDKENVKLAVSGRISDFVALFAMSAELANEVMGITLDVDKIFDFCYLHIVIANENEGNIAKHAHSALAEYISINKERFADATCYTGCRTFTDNIILNSNEDGFCHEIRTKVIDGDEYQMVYVFRMGSIQNVLSDAGFPDAKVALFKMRESGYLKTKDKNRNTYPYTINGLTQPCVAVYYKDDTLTACEIEDH